MNKFSRRAISVAACLAAFGAPMLASAESNVSTGTGTPLTTTAHVDFSVVVPKFVSLQVGTAGSGIDGITFTVPGLTVGNGTAVAGVGGDQTGGVVTAILKGNNGNITLTSVTGGALSDGAAGDTLSFTQISTTAGVRTAALPVLQPPPLGDGVAGTGTVTVTATNKIVNSDAKWTFSYLNTAIPAAGTYGGVNTNNSRVTYTASMP
jgi:hypothetical protein